MAQYLSKKELKQEFFKCARDPFYYIKHYCKISHPTKQLIPLRPWDFQKDLLYKFKDYRFNIILKSRQLGISTIVAGYISWLMLFHREKNILNVATKLKTAKIIVAKVKKIFYYLPPWFSQLAKIIVDNETNFELSNGSKISASSTSMDAGLGEALSLLVIDEAAHVENLDGLWRSIGPTIAAGGRCIALSTPNGSGGWFYKTYRGAEAGQNEFHPTKLMWDVHPERDDKWLEKEKANFSKRQFEQEYCCSFLASGEKLIEPEDLQKIQNSLKEPDFKDGFDRNLWIWEEPQPDEKYFMAADVARGDGEDNSAFHIFRISNFEQVGEYKGKIAPDFFGEFLNEIGRRYNGCMIVVENNNLGWSVCKKLEELDYPNLYYSSKGSHQYLDRWEAEAASNSVPGFTVGPKMRPRIISKLEEIVRGGEIKINSIRTLTELETFVWINGKAQAQKGYNDDLTMCLAIGCWVFETVLQENVKEVAYKKAFLGAITKSNTMFDTSVPGMHGHRRNNDLRKRIENHKENLANFGWIFKG